MGLLRKGGACQEVLELAAQLKRDACEEQATPGLRRMLSTVSHIPGRVCEWDAFYWRHPATGVQSRGLMMVDVGSRCPLAVIHETAKDQKTPVGNLTAKEAIRIFLLHWLPHRAKPRAIRLDPDGAFVNKQDLA